MSEYKRMTSKNSLAGSSLEKLTTLSQDKWMNLSDQFSDGNSLQKVANDIMSLETVSYGRDLCKPQVQSFEGIKADYKMGNGPSDTKDVSKMNTRENTRYYDERLRSIDQKIDQREEVLALKIDKLVEKVDSHSKKMDDHLEHNRHMMEMFAQRNQTTDERLNSMEGRIDGRLSSIDGRINNIRWWFVGSVIAIILGFAGSIFGLAQLQNSWIQQYIDLIIKMSG